MELPAQVRRPVVMDDSHDQVVSQLCVKVGKTSRERKRKVFHPLFSNQKRFSDFFKNMWKVLLIKNGYRLYVDIFLCKA